MVGSKVMKTVSARWPGGEARCTRALVSYPSREIPGWLLLYERRPAYVYASGGLLLPRVSRLTDE